MSQPRLAVIAILGLTTLTAAGLAYHHYQRAEELAARLAAEQAKATDLPTPRVRNTSVAAAQATEDDILTESTREAHLSDETTDEDEETSPNNRNRSRRDMGARIAALMADPEYASAFNLQQRSRLDRTYADLFAQLNLPPATLSKLQDLLVEKQNTARDVFMAAREEGLSGRDNREELRALVEATQAEIDAEIRSAIGESNFAALQNYEQTGRQRAVVEQFESRLSYSGTPLNSAQAQALTGILAETSTTTGGDSFRRGGDFPGGGRGGVQITDAAISRAQAVLSAAQLQSLQSLQAEQQAAQKLREAMRDQAQSARERAEPPPSGQAGGGG